MGVLISDPSLRHFYSTHGHRLRSQEACIHGALPWRADHQRRALLYRFNPGHAAYTPGVAEFVYPDWVEDMTEEEKAIVLQPGYPSSMRLDRQPGIAKSAKL